MSYCWFDPMPQSFKIAHHPTHQTDKDSTQKGGVENQCHSWFLFFFCSGMGNNHSFTAEELEELQKGTSFSKEQILRLHKRFRKLDTDGNGEISRDEFQSIPGLSANPLLERVLTIFDTVCFLFGRQSSS